MAEYLTDGFPTRVTFYALGTGTTLLMKETEVTPPGISAGGENDTTTMRNTTWRTKQPKSLKTLTNSSLVFQYDPAVYDQILSIIGVNGMIHVDFPDEGRNEFTISYLIFLKRRNGLTWITPIKNQFALIGGFPAC